MEILEKSLECDVILPLEERIWRDRRELGIQVRRRDASGVARVRAKLRDFLTRMQLGPVPDEAAGRDPEIRF
jgi:hypothetical protein